MPPARWLTDDEQRTWRGYRRMKALLDLAVGRDLTRDSRLSEPDYDVLSTLTEEAGPPWRASELAARLLWSSSRLAHQVGRMERRGLVSRTPSDDDRRGALVHLTQLGRATLESAAPPHVASVRRNFIDLLTPDELHLVGDIAWRVVANLTDDAPEVDAAADGIHG